MNNFLKLAATGAQVDYQFLFNIAVTFATGLAGWALGRVTKTLDRLDNDLRGLSDKYLSKADYHRDQHEIKELLHRILDKLDAKVDK